MHASVSSSLERKEADIVVVPLWADKKGPRFATEAKEFEKLAAFALKAGDFRAKAKETLLLYRDAGKEKRVLLLGLGEEKACVAETLRSCFGSLVKKLCALKVARVNFLLPRAKDLEAVAEGVLLASYSFDQFKNRDETPPLQHSCFCGSLKLEQLKKVQIIVSAVNQTRDLVNGNADDVNVEHFKALAKQLGKEFKSLKVSILDKKALEKEKMGLMLAVGRAAQTEPALILFEYTGNPRSKEKIALVGKGITYDTGGLNIKVSGSSMETMKSDMAGAAAVVGMMRAAAELKLEVNLIGALAVAENAIGSLSYKPGDVFRGRSGKTVEITNTDAEGRLVLADAICYVESTYHPTTLIDFATLTGGVVIALGDEAAGLFATDEKLATALEKAAMRTHERIWRLPLYSEYKEDLKSKIADLKNSGSRKASAAQGATFIHEFVTTAAWAHLDIAGTAYLSEERAYHATPATAIGVRLIIDFLEHLHA